MKKKAYIRPMYKTDPNYRKGMECLVEEGTEIILAKHFDRGLLNLNKFKDTHEINTLYEIYDNIDWKLAGY